MKKVTYVFSIILISVAIVNIIGAIAINSKSYSINKFFSLYNQISDGIKSNLDRTINYDTNKFRNLLKGQKVYYSNARYDDEKWIVELKLLGDNNNIHQWFLDKEMILNNKTNNKTLGKVFSHAEPRSPLVLSNKSCLIFLDETKYFMLLDSNSKIIWCNNDFQYHHTFNLNNDMIWVCGREIINSKTWENFVVGIDIKTGKTIFKSSTFTSLFIKSQNHWLLGNSNNVTAEGNDPYHLNDVEVANIESEYWNKGDLFLSLRHRSAIVHYRPSQDTIISVIHGPFMLQHDVDILDKNHISFFNNNAVPTDWGNYKVLNDNHLNISNICVYDFSSKKFSFPNKEFFIKNKIFTVSEGLHHILNNGDVFIENQNSGIVYYYNKLGTLLYYGKLNNVNERTHWPRIYESKPF